MTGPLAGVTVVELAGIGPAPFAAMLLADMGARVVRVDAVRDLAADYTPNPVLERGRESIAVDLKATAGRDVVLRLVAASDVLVEGFRPGVTERLGVGPADCHAVNPRLVYGRMTGWGQDGPRAREAGHDINYIGLTGALHAIGRHGTGPVPPLNLVGDFGGGAMFLAYGVVCALLEARTSGLGQVVDANVVDGTTTLMGLVHGLQAVGLWSDEPGTNLLDTGAPFYDVYRCSDDRWVAVGCVEHKFFVQLLDVLGLDPALANAHRVRDQWPALRAALTARLATRTRDEWVEAAAGRDACLTPVLDLGEAARDPHATARATYRPLPGLPSAVQAAPAPRFSRSVPEPTTPAVPVGAHTRALLAELGFDADAAAALLADRVVR